MAMIAMAGGSSASAVYGRVTVIQTEGGIALKIEPAGLPEVLVVVTDKEAVMLASGLVKRVEGMGLRHRDDWCWLDAETHPGD